MAHSDGTDSPRGVRASPPDPRTWPRIIAHVDADAFFASVEIRDNPSLADKPVVVGGSPDGRGVVSTCNYVARTYGIHSAMPAAQARRLCPHAVFLRGDFRKYGAASRAIRTIFDAYTDLVQPLSLDEAHLDLSRSPGDPLANCRAIKARVREEVGVSVSVGLSYNKFLAKLASDWDKPDGFTVWGPAEAAEILRDLPVQRIWGVGPKTAKHLQARGWHTAGDLQAAGVRALVDAVGVWGHELHQLSQGIDHRPVQPRGRPKSIGREETFERDIHGRDACLAELAPLAEAVAHDLRRHGARGRTVTLKVKYADFRLATRAQALPRPTQTASAIYAAAAALLEKIEPERPIRLLGISLSHLQMAGDFEQPSLLGDDDPSGAAPASEDRNTLDAVEDTLRERFGRHALQRARGLAGRRGRRDEADH